MRFVELKNVRRCLFVVGLCMGVTLAAYQEEPPKVWSYKTETVFSDLLSVGKYAEEPWSKHAKDVLTEAMNKPLGNRDLEMLADNVDSRYKSVQECLEALMLLSFIHANDAAGFRREHEFFKDEFPKSSYEVYLVPSKLLRQCPTCKGRSAQTVNCKACKNTQMCSLCNGKGVRVLRGMRHTRRRPVYYSDPHYYERGSSQVDNNGYYRRTGSHTTRNYGRSTVVEEVTSGDEERTCPKCRGTGKCTVCMNARKKSECPTCHSFGVVPDASRIEFAKKAMIKKGIEELSKQSEGGDSAYYQTRDARLKLVNLNQIEDVDTVIASLTKVLADYPKCEQKTVIERLIRELRNVKELQEQFRKRAEAKAKVIKADTDALAAEIDAAKAIEGIYMRNEALDRLVTMYPKATNRDTLDMERKICRDEIERTEERLRNALKLIETVENPEVGLRRVEAMLKTIDPVSPVVGAIQAMREHFIEQQKKQTKKRYIIIAVASVVTLLIVYFLFDILSGIYNRRRD